jgi:peroxiredoxin
MTIKIGDKLPDVAFTVMGADGPAKKTTAEVFAGKKVALFAVPGAYTPTCQQQHMPGFVSRVDELKAKGIDTIACTAVNDIFVLTQFAKDAGATGNIPWFSATSATISWRPSAATPLRQPLRRAIAALGS